jgi:hypothetical protein
MKLRTFLLGLAAAVCAAAPVSAQTLTSWEAPVKVVAADGSLTKSAGCEGCPDSGAHSAIQLTGDGYAEFVPGANQRIIAGLGGDLSAATDSTTIDHAFSLWPGGGWEVRERGAYRTEGAFAAGDRFRVAVENGTVVYRKNGAVVYTSGAAPAFPLALDVTLYSVGASLTQAAVVPSGPTLTSWDAPLNVVAAGGSLTKSAGCEGCPDAGAHSAIQLTGEGSAEFVPAANHRIIAGLGTDLSAATASSTIDYAFSLWPGGGWEVRERGMYRTEGSFAAGDRFRVAVEGTRVVYRKNGAVVYTSGVPPTFPLVLDVTLYSIGASLTQATVAGAGAPPSAPAPSAPLPPSPPPPAGGGPIVTAIGPYAAVVDRQTYAKPVLPVLASAGASAADPVFQSTIFRLTDSTTRPGHLNRSYRTPSSTHLNTWSADLSYFYVVSTDGAVIPYTFDQNTGAAQRINPTATGNGGLTLSFYIEPQFSFVSDSLIYGSYTGPGGNLHTIDQYDFSTSSYTRILDLETLAAGLAGTYIGGLGSSAGPNERLMAFFGGSSQDRHHYLVVFDKANPANRLLVDTHASTVNGVASSIPLNFSLHSAAIDQSGRYLMLYPTAADHASARKAPQSVLWDTQANTFTELGVSARPYGHDTFGYGMYVNQDCCTSSTYDAAQWQFRSLSSPFETRDLIANVLTPKVVYMAEHATWNNARPDRLMPFISGLYRYGTETTAPRAWDGEIVAVQTDAPAGADATVWRFAHHRSDVTSDLDAARTSFWYMPRPNVSPDGRWVLFTSNWEKTLGIDPTGEPGSGARQDVFLVKLTSSDATQTGQPAATSGPMTIDAPWVLRPRNGGL